VEKKLKFVRMAALLGAVSGASVFLGLGSTVASAGEQRLHGEFTATYGLIPLIERSGNDNATSPKSTKTATASVSRSKKGNSQPDEPKIEDPPLPGYDGDNVEATQSMNSAAGKSRGKAGNNG
jgi:hypothetical protein